MSTAVLDEDPDERRAREVREALLGSTPKESPVTAAELQQRAEAQAQIPRTADGRPIPAEQVVSEEERARNPSLLENAVLPAASVGEDIAATEKMPPLSGVSSERAVATIQVGEAPPQTFFHPDMNQPLTPDKAAFLRERARTADDNPALTQNGAAPEKLSEEDTDPRQIWLCVTAEGPRTGHPAFHSDDHLLVPPRRIQCPQCGSTHVRKPLGGESL